MDQNHFCTLIDKKKLASLLIGVIMIYFTFMVGGVLHEYILKQPYKSRFDATESYFSNPPGLIAIQKIVIFFFGFLYNKAFLPQTTKSQIPAKNSLICAFLVFISSLTNNYAIIMVSYPIVVMFKSCNILSVIMIGVICSRVRDKSLKLGGKKIIGAVAVTTGMIIFKVFDPQAKAGDQRKVQLFGLMLLVVSLLADGFLPDFQAEIKQKYKPQPTIMLVEINKWCSLLSIAYCIIAGYLQDFITFSWSHPLFLAHLLTMSCLAFIGHIFIYKMIKDFRQHIVPFVITTRKIISVGISMLYFSHSSSFMQIVGILVVFAVTLFEFYMEIVRSQVSQANNLQNKMFQKLQNRISERNQDFKEMQESKKMRKDSTQSFNSPTTHEIQKGFEK